MLSAWPVVRGRGYRISPGSPQAGPGLGRVGERSRRRSGRGLVARAPLRGEGWMVGLRPTPGHGRDLVRPAVVIPSDGVNRSAADLGMGLPVVRNFPGMPF